MRIIDWCLCKFFVYDCFHLMDEIYRLGFMLVLVPVGTVVTWALFQALEYILTTCLAVVWDMWIINLRLKKLGCFFLSSSEALVFISVITLFIGSAENALEGTSTFLQILFAITLDNYQGRFKLVVCSTVSYIFGLVVLQLFAETPRNTNKAIPWICWFLLQITFPMALHEVSLKSYLEKKDMPLPAREENKERRRRIYNWLEFAIAIVPAVIFHWLSMFLSHAEFCNLNDPMCISIFDVLLVIQIAVLKRHVVVNAITANVLIMNNSSEGSTRMAPRISRRLDKASFVIEEENRPATVAFLLGMVPMWTTFLVFSLVDATGSTFFLNQARNIDKKFPIVFNILVTVTSFAIDYLCDFLFRKIGNGQLIMQWRIGVGMTFSFICCIFAWRIALHKTYTEPSMHKDIFSLTPQFLLLGFMKGFSERGLQSFFRSLLSESLSEYRTPFGECVMCIGKFLTTLCILKFRTSCLGNYYAILAILSFVNLLSYWVAHCYRDDQISPQQQIPHNLSYISASTRCLTDMMPNNPSYFSVSPRKMRSLLGPACPRTPRRLDDAHAVLENQVHINVFDFEYRDDL